MSTTQATIDMLKTQLAILQRAGFARLANQVMTEKDIEAERLRRAIRQLGKEPCS